MQKHSRSNYQLGAFRLLNTKQATWLNRDPSGSVGQPSYAYCNGNPVNFRDPSGLEPEVFVMWMSAGSASDIGVGFHGDVIVIDDDGSVTAVVGHKAGLRPDGNGIALTAAVTHFRDMRKCKEVRTVQRPFLQRIPHSALLTDAQFAQRVINYGYQYQFAVTRYDYNFNQTSNSVAYSVLVRAGMTPNGSVAKIGRKI